MLMLTMMRSMVMVMLMSMMMVMVMLMYSYHGCPAKTTLDESELLQRVFL